MSKIIELAKKDRKILKQGSVINMTPPKANFEENCMVDALSHKDIFSVEECAKIMTLAPEKWEDAKVSIKLNKSDKADEGHVNKEVRNNSSHMIMANEDTYWLFEKLLYVVTAANKIQYKFDVNHFDAVQLSRYRVGEYYGKHMDIGPGRLGNRKISLTLQITDPSEYEGGDLILDFDDFAAPRDIGSVTLFPSFMKHWVTPVTKGTRYSIVAWVSGENRFK